MPLPSSSRASVSKLEQGESREPCSHGFYAEPPPKFGDSQTTIVDGHAHYTAASAPPPPGGWYAKSPGTLCVSEAQIILWILLSVIDDVAVVTE